ncbi:MAG: DUF362 domain-containing protein [Bacteroidales bacterium]|jgi:uncharacterized protein (DUF362 family)/Pyruvate/2-oxoacid:ferredoxin oxidoreductase delta subunit|nr:DUF362 domain-containing protein [Bacteroidales bacterium]
MNNRVFLRRCEEYDPAIVEGLIEEIWSGCGGPPVKDRTVLLKPNILTDEDPARCISTHPAVVEAMVRFLMREGARVIIGDSPAVHLKSFSGTRSGIRGVCERTGAGWIDFTDNPGTVTVAGKKMKIARAALDADLVISMPKFKTHELMYFTGAIKNTFGLVPGLIKAKQHALHQSRESFASFLVDLNEAFLPHFFLLDGVMAMEGPGPGNGFPVKTGVVIGSSNPVALDIIASSIAGYNPMEIPTSRIALTRGRWLSSIEEIEYDGPDLRSVIKPDFLRVGIRKNGNVAVQFVVRRIRPLRKLEHRPVFIRKNCTGCGRCMAICPMKALRFHPSARNRVLLTDIKCIRCFCCSEVCPSAAIEIRRKLFGQ